mmetsp:Transcript_62812/g.141887  ORF Transcript_62812/g.141887 Transcript_62812/m.141887 type:complete len:240 (+) Transcript_62812:89-808(+)
MGCGSSGPTADDLQAQSKFLNATIENETYIEPSSAREKRTLVMKKAALKSATDTHVVKDGDAEILKIVPIQGRKRLYWKDTHVATVVLGARDSEVQGVDSTMNLPHMYVYTFKSVLDGQKASDYQEDDKSLYYWARVVKNGTSTFEVSKADQMPAADSKENIDLFTFPRYVVKKKMVGKDTLYEMKLKVGDKTSGCALGFLIEDQEEVRISMVKNADPILLVAVVICMEALQNLAAGAR